MPIPSQKIGETFAKDATRVRSLLRVSNIPFKLPDDHPATTVVDNYRLVSVQEDNATKKLYAVLGWKQKDGYTVIYTGVLENAAQAESLENKIKEGDLVTVLSDYTDVYMIKIDSENAPTHGINSAYVDNFGRLSSLSTNNVLFRGSIWTGMGQTELQGQLKSGHVFARLAP